ncbi:MAG: tRNA (guanosine(46)-N7)-methyltransferase TrmB [Pseudomonadota bacterium]
MSYIREQDMFRTFGRAKGRTLSPAQEARMAEHWPRLEITPGAPLPPAPRWLEIGYGTGTHLLHLAQANPDISIIGAEPFLNGTAKAVRGIVENGFENVRLFRGDVRELMAEWPDACLQRAFILFPDPWPKARHNKRRLIRSAFVAELHRLIAPGGDVTFASDIDHYVDWALVRFRSHGGWRWDEAEPTDPPQGWPGTKYEAKARREGRTPRWFKFVKV